MPPLYQWIVETAHREWLQGATVLTGFFGLGPEGSLLEEHAWSIARDRPVIVEVVDEPARIEALLARVEPVFREGVITLERARVLLYRGARGRRPAARPHGLAPGALPGLGETGRRRCAAITFAAALRRHKHGTSDTWSAPRFPGCPT